MANSDLTALKTRIKPYRDALYDFGHDDALARLRKLTSKNVVLRMCTPFGTFDNAKSYFEATYGALSRAVPDMECRDQIRISGRSQIGQDWVGIMGSVVGVFDKPFLDIPPTGHLIHMRYHEFYRFEDAKIAELHAVWDIPELMMQAQAWPMAPGLGREWSIPGPAERDGIGEKPSSPKRSASAIKIVGEMLEQMKSYPEMGGPETMRMEKYWHPKMSWYGPAGIGSTRGFAGFQHWHMKPWVQGMPNWSQQDFQELCHFIGDNSYVGETGWPAMQQTLVADGFRGIAPAGQKLDIRGLDFWRLDGNLIRENWVMVDLLHIYEQLGVDVLARMREFTNARVFGHPKFP